MAAVAGSHQTVIRIAGYLILVVSAALGLVAVMAFMRTNEMASLLAPTAVAHGQVLDPADWAFHWRISSVILLLLGGAGIVAGVGMVRGRKWGLLLWCATITVLLIGQGVSNLIAQYAFEQTRIVEGVVTLLLCAGSWAAWWRLRPLRKGEFGQ